MNKTALILILTLTVSSLMIAESTSAQSIPKPSVPQFTLTYHAILYYVPPTYAIDHYTGENITVSYEHWIRQTSIEVTIENQPFSPYVITDNGDNRTTNLYFSVRSKGQFEEEWSTYSNSGELQIEDYAAQQTTLYLYPDSTPWLSGSRRAVCEYSNSR